METGDPATVGRGLVRMRTVALGMGGMAGGLGQNLTQNGLGSEQRKQGQHHHFFRSDWGRWQSEHKQEVLRKRRPGMEGSWETQMAWEVQVRGPGNQVRAPQSWSKAEEG